MYKIIFRTTSGEIIGEVERTFKTKKKAEKFLDKYASYFCGIACIEEI